MELTIFRGTNEIGGSCIELKQDNTKILFDFGIPLEAMDIKDFKIEDYKPNISSNYEAVFLSHAHPDHYGLLGLLDKETPIYATAETCNILKNIAPLTTKFDTNELNLKVIEAPLQIGKFLIIPHDIDHSIGGACAYEIQCNGKTIVYTGDIRFHGRCQYKNSVFKRKLDKVDYLIMEGTTISREQQTIVKEEDLKARFVEVFSTSKLPIVAFSPQNIDRFITVYKACIEANKTLVIDPYTSYILELYGIDNKNIPQFNWKNIRVYFASNSITSALAETKKLYKYKASKITIDEIINEPTKFVIKGNHIINERIFESIPKENLSIIYSMWKGYLDKPSQFDNYKDIITHIHTSGHAYVEDLQAFVNDVKPACIIPIHTECKDKYSDLFNAEIMTLDDNITVKL